MRRLVSATLPSRTLCAHAALALALSAPSVVLAQIRGEGRPSRSNDQNEPTVIQAEQMTGRPDREVYLEREVDVVRGQTQLNSDKATYHQEDNVVEGEGNARMTRFGDRYWGDKFKYNLDTGEGWVLKPRYKLLESNAQGKGERADFENSERSTVIKGTYSTCDGDRPDWYLSADTVELDQGADTGTAFHSTVRFKDVAFLYVPRMSFPLTDGRKSGFLAPTFGTTSSGGFEMMTPYYFNIAPNRDLTLYPKVITRRGFQLGGEARYLEENYAGETKFEYLPSDRLTSSDRYALSTTHAQRVTPNLSFGWNVNMVSDDKYFTDFTNHFDGLANSLTGLTNANTTASAQRLLSREVGMNYAGANWNANLRVTNYQSLQDEAADLANQVMRPYQRLPQLSFRTWQPNAGGLDWSVDAEWTRFWLNDWDLQYNRSIVLASGALPSSKGMFGDRGDRLILKPQVAYSIQEPGYFLKPKLSMHMTSYQIENPLDASRPTSFNRALPTFSLDSGLVFERNTRIFNQELTQTLEPRLFYVYTPYKDQSLFPNFDSADPALTFAQLFNENRFSGSDRIADANQLTAAVTSRFLDKNGAERARLAIGQRFYFQDQRVFLDAASHDNRSDLLLAASATLSPKLSTEAALQYGQSQNQVNNAYASIQWKPDYKQVFNASYRYMRGTTDVVGLNQFNLSGQWPIADRWHAVGLISYSVPENQIIQGLLGLEYNADCWVFRVVGQRLTTATSSSGSSFYVQLQLNGLSKIGTGAVEALRRTIPGYQYKSEAGGSALQ